eukprot:Pompholyxophrys_sp_v1_NODE_156_length_1477_cov_16.734880.p3 type:complete len:107 gc:universal NODE_156_length_1477_cov_16.734880:210-530(+)
MDLSGLKSQINGSTKNSTELCQENIVGTQRKLVLMNFAGCIGTRRAKLWFVFTVLSHRSSLFSRSLANNHWQPSFKNWRKALEKFRSLETSPSTIKGLTHGQTPNV